MTAERLNLGCGQDYRAGWHNVDISERVHADEYVDLGEAPWPWAEGQFRAVEARHVLEHLDRLVFGEVCHVLEPGGRFRWVYPIGHTRFEDATHEQYWNCNTAEQITGDREHGHETGHPLTLVDRDVRWRVPDRPTRWAVRALVWNRGAGPWLSQVPGLSGEVVATYRRDGGGA